MRQISSIRCARQRGKSSRVGVRLLGRGCSSVDHDVITEPVQLSEQLSFPLVADVLRVGCSRFAIRFIAQKHVVNADRKLVRDSHSCYAFSPSAAEALKTSGDVRTAAPACRGRGLHQNALQKRIAVARAGLATTSSALTIAGAQTSPRRKVSVRGPAGHVGADFGEYIDSDGSIDPRNGIQLGDRALIRRRFFFDEMFELGNRCFDPLDHLELNGKQPRMFRREVAAECLNQLITFWSQLAARQFSQRTSVGDSIGERTQHATARYAERFGSDRRKLDVGRLQHLVHAKLRRCGRLHQFAPIASELPKLAHGLGRNEVWSNQTVSQQRGDPFRIVHVGLPPRHVGHMPCVAEDDLKVIFQNTMDRLPVHAGALHRNVSTSRSQQPIAQLLKLPSKCAERSLDGSRCQLVPSEPTRNDRLLVNVQPRPSLDQNLHDTLLLGCVSHVRRGSVEKLLCVLIWTSQKATNDGTYIDAGPTYAAGSLTTSERCDLYVSDTRSVAGLAPPFSSRPMVGRHGRSDLCSG